MADGSDIKRRRPGPPPPVPLAGGFPTVSRCFLRRHSNGPDRKKGKRGTQTILVVVSGALQKLREGHPSPRPIIEYYCATSFPGNSRHAHAVVVSAAGRPNAPALTRPPAVRTRCITWRALSSRGVFAFFAFVLPNDFHHTPMLFDTEIGGGGGAALEHDNTSRVTSRVVKFFFSLSTDRREHEKP